MIIVHFTNYQIEVTDVDEIVVAAGDRSLEIVWPLAQFCAEFPHIELPPGMLTMSYEPGANIYHLNTRDQGVVAFAAPEKNHYLDGIHRNVKAIKKMAIQKMIEEFESQL